MVLTKQKQEREKKKTRKKEEKVEFIKNLVATRWTVYLLMLSAAGLFKYV